MDREPIDLYALDALADDIEGFEDVVRLANHPKLGWQRLYGGPIPADELFAALQRLVADELVEPLTLDAKGTTLLPLDSSAWMAGEDPTDLWFRITSKGRTIHAAWEPE